MTEEEILLKCPKSVVAEVKGLLREIQALRGKVRYLSSHVPRGVLKMIENRTERDWQIYESLKGDYKLESQSGNQ